MKCAQWARGPQKKAGILCVNGFMSSENPINHTVKWLTINVFCRIRRFCSFGHRIRRCAYIESLKSGQAARK